MNNPNWKDEIKQFMQNELCTDSDIEDFVHNHTENLPRIMPELQQAISQLNATKQEALLAMAQALEKES